MSELARLLDAVHAAARKLASQGDINAVLRDVLSLCVEAVGASAGTIYLHEPGTKTLKFLHVLPEEVANTLRRLDIPDDFGVAGQVFQSGKLEISEFPVGGDPKRHEIERKTGIKVRTLVTVPLQITGMQPIGVVQLLNKVNGVFTETDAAVLDTVSDICTLAVINSRLLEQSTRVASLEGMGRAAHDLANKAGVLMTFLPDFQRGLDGLKAALDDPSKAHEACMYLQMLEGTYTDVFAPYSERVYRYARLINDLAAGKKLTPKKKLGSLGATLRESVQYIEPQARQNRVQIVYDIQEDAPEFLFDDLYVMRIAENLVGNAVKAVREVIPDEWLIEHAEDDATYGKVTVSYRFENGEHVLQVTDQGPGMSPATIKQILSGQAKSAWERGSGSGLGTKVVMDLSATHDAKVGINSRLEEGSTFKISFPHVLAETDAA